MVLPGQGKFMRVLWGKRQRASRGFDVTRCKSVLGKFECYGIRQDVVLGAALRGRTFLSVKTMGRERDELRAFAFATHLQVDSNVHSPYLGRS